MIKKIVNWFRNYWYYYKWPVIIGAFFIGVILFCTLNTGHRGSYDCSVYYIGPHIMTPEEQNGICSAFAQVLSADLNDDGRKDVDLIDQPAYTDAQYEALLDENEDDDDMSIAILYAPYREGKVGQAFSQQMMTGDAMICLMDPFWYRRAAQNGGFAPLEQILGYRPEEAQDDFAAALKDMPFGAFFADSFAGLPDDTVVCFRVMPSSAVFTGKDRAEKLYRNGKTLFSDIFAFSL